MKANCSYCTNEINRRPSDLKGKKNVFCDRTCHNKWKSENTKGENNHNFSSIKYNCDYCTEEFLLKLHILKELEDGKRKNIFCCRDCHNDWRRENKSRGSQPTSGKFEIECKYCTETFLVDYNKIKRAKFCSKDCKDKSEVNRIIKQCLNCNNDFEEFPSEAEKRKFCSLKCNGEWCKNNNTTKVKKKCVICNEDYKVSPSLSHDSVTCSKKCQGLNNLRNQKFKDTKPERMVREYLEKNNINFIPQCLILKRYNVDFYLPEYDMIIEVQGNYWHGNPRFYGDEEGKIPLTEKQKDRIKRDKVRHEDLDLHFQNVYFVWEEDIYENTNEALYFLK